MTIIGKIKEKLKDRICMAVANEVGLHPNTVYKIKNATDPDKLEYSHKTVRKLAKYLEIPCDD